MPRVNHTFYQEDLLTLSRGGPSMPYVVAEVIDQDWCRVDNTWCKIGELIEISDAPAYYSEQIRRGDRSSKLLRLRGVAWTSLQEYERAIDDFSEGVLREPSESHWLTDRATAFYRKGDTEAAIADLRSAIAMNQKYWYPKLMLAWILSTAPDERFRDSSEALKIIESIVKSNGEINQLKPVRAAALASASRFAEAAEYHKENIIALQEKTYVGWRKSWQEERLRFNRQRLALYQGNNPLRDESRTFDWHGAIKE